MADFFSELKRIKAQLKIGSAEPTGQPTREQVKPLPGLPQVTPLKKLHNYSMAGSRGNPVNGLASSAEGRAHPSHRPPNTAPSATRHPHSTPAAPAAAPSTSTQAPRPLNKANAAYGQRSAPSTQVTVPTRHGSSGLARAPTPPTHLPVLRKSVPTQPSAAVTPPIRLPAPAPGRPAQAPIQRTEPVPSAFRPLPKGALTRQGLFRQPAPWLSAGGKTQCGDTGHRGAVDIVIGLDFGTSYTKAAVGFRDKIFPVTWEGVSKCEPHYLLPSEYTELGNGSLYIGQHPDASTDQVRRDLKLPFINAGVSSDSIGAASIFIAMVLRYVRAWVFHHHAAKLGRAQIRWQLNVGAPSNGLESSPLVRAYRTLAATSWQRSLEADSLRLAGNASALWRDGEALLDLVGFEVRPEFVAQMAGYMQSSQRQRGLHALVDVGGGTLDVVTFNVHRVEDEDTFPFLVPQVHALGTHCLIQNRLLGVEGGVRANVVDELAPIDAAPAFARNIGIAEAHVSRRDTLFKGELRRVIKSVFDTTKSRRYRLSDAWHTGVRTFFTGGGSRFDLYRDALVTTAVPSAQGLHLMPLPPHKNLDGFSGGDYDYQRVSVACGLAQDAFALGRIVPAREVEDDRPAALSYRASRPDRDELYPK
jgi:hypothetical protein